MRELNYNEILTINGGDDCHPTVSSDPNVQHGYGVGWHIGHAIGNAVQMFGAVVDKINPFNWGD